MTEQNTSASVDLEKVVVEPDDIQREISLENSQTSGSSTESNHPSSLPGKLTNEEDGLSRIESATSAIYDPASRIPTNAPRESGIIGI